MFRCVRACLLVFLFVSLSFGGFAATIGSPNTVTADPPVSRPSTTPCIVQLFQNTAFADFTPKTFSFAAPSACPGPWAKVIFDVDMSVTAGRQFDRTMNVWLGGANIYFGTTAEPGRTVSPQWHVERDLTEYSALFNSASSGEADLGNVVNSTYTGILYGTAQLEFYPADKSNRAPKAADQVLPLASGPTGETVALFTAANQLAQTFTLPTNIERAYLDVYAQSQSSDEFWYTCVPNDVAGLLQSCPGTAFRETEVSIDGVPAGVAPVYPWIYTGGIDPYLWRPIPGVETLDFRPYRVDLSPFAGVLSNGQPHVVALNVYNADSYFSATANLLVYLDHGSSSVSGDVTVNTLASGPTPVVTENLVTDASGNITGSVATTSARHFQISGYANTSHGKVTTTVTQNLRFSNKQNFDITASSYKQYITQTTGINSTTTVAGGSEGEDARSHAESQAWPLSVKIDLEFHPDGTISQYTASQQTSNRSDVASGGEDDGAATSSVANSVKAADTLVFDSSFNLISHKGQKSSQSYFSQDSKGNCYSETLTAVNDLLASVTDGVGCK